MYKPFSILKEKRKIKSNEIKYSIMSGKLTFSFFDIVNNETQRQDASDTVDSVP